MFHIDKTYPLSTSIVVNSLNPKKDLFRSKENNEQILGPDITYLNIIGALMSLTQCTISNIAFSL